jgi:hypothetical protein
MKFGVAKDYLLGAMSPRLIGTLTTLYSEAKLPFSSASLAVKKFCKAIATWKEKSVEYSWIHRCTTI